jgi:hypothetical protein
LARSRRGSTQSTFVAEKSKKVARQKPTSVKDMTPEERAAWREQMQEHSKP